MHCFCFILFKLENKAKPERFIGDLFQLLFICWLEPRRMVSGYVLCANSFQGTSWLKLPGLEVSQKRYALGKVTNILTNDLWLCKLCTYLLIIMDIANKKMNAFSKEVKLDGINPS